MNEFIFLFTKGNRNIIILLYIKLKLLILIIESYGIKPTIYMKFEGSGYKTILNDTSNYDCIPVNLTQIESIYVNGALQRTDYYAILPEEENNVTVVFNTELTSLNYMFYGLQTLISLDLSSLDTS